MSTITSDQLKDWKTPDALLQYHRLKQKKKQLTARCSKNKNVGAQTLTKESLLEVVVAQKRKNPFARNEICKRIRTEEIVDDQNDDSLFNLINNAKPTCINETPPPPAQLQLRTFDAKKFAEILNSANANEDLIDIKKEKWIKHLPIDWCIKTRIRLFCETSLPTTTLKASQEASGITSFVRCIDQKNSTDGLDISLGARLNKCNYFWQHPHLPWMTMFPRNSKANNGITIGEREKLALAKDWSDSFHGLFKLLRARQCPYFYLCANTFTVLFRAGGVGSRVEMHAIMTPTSRGMRSALKKEGIEFGMPFKKDANLNRSNEENSTATDLSQSQDIPQSQDMPTNPDNEDNEDDDLEEEEWLESLGVDKNEIKKISTAHARNQLHKEMVDDFSETSLVLIEGAECQAFFNFLLNAKSGTATVGRLAGVPPTLLSPVSFPLATMQTLTTRSSKIRMEGVDYFSIELKGIILPHILNYICLLLAETKDKFSATLVSSNCTLALSKASQKIIEFDKEKNCSDEIFGKENLSDCGLLSEAIDAICRTGVDSTLLLERVVYNKDLGYGCS